jgi:hypothetical protein
MLKSDLHIHCLKGMARGQSQEDTLLIISGKLDHFREMEKNNSNKK